MPRTPVCKICNMLVTNYMIIFETVICKIWSRMITCKEVVRHNIKVVQKENLQKKICPQNLQNFTEMIRNDNLQICFTEPPYEKISRTKSCTQDNDNQKQIAKSCPAEQFVNKLSGTTRISTTIISKNTAYGSQCVFCQSKLIWIISSRCSICWLSFHYLG